MKLTERDRDLLETLAGRVRIISTNQVARGWWPHLENPSSSVSRRLRQLCECGWIQSHTALARPLPPLQKPVTTWRPGQPAPSYGEVSYRLRKRWHHGARRLRVFTPGPLVGSLGGIRARGRLRFALQVTHDLAMAEIYLRLREENPGRAARWKGEDSIPATRSRGKLPDAIIAKAAQHEPPVAIEFGGSYDKARVRAFHKHCVQHGLAYELW